MSVIRRIFKSAAQREQFARDAEVADPIIDRLVAATDKRLAHLKDLRETLRAPVLAAHEAMRRAIATIPGPTEVSPRAWSQDATVKALFARAEDAAAAFSNDPVARAFFAGHPGCDCFALLGLEKHDKRVLSTVMQGEIQAEVTRTTVSFTEPQILAPAGTEAEVRAELALRALENLALRALERVGAVRAQRHELEKERSLLQAELRLAQRRGAGFGALAGGEASRTAQIERDLEATVRELEAAASNQLLPGLLEALVDVLANPHDYLKIEPCTLALDAMNFEAEPSAGAEVLRLAMLELARRPTFGVLIARFPRVELRADTRLADAEKLL
ncbi:MAG TPA: hypothetical protein VLT89_11675 [Usitatibacter sp.]|nr:hypothetical protein [Usitatibacter sp.]